MAVIDSYSESNQDSALDYGSGATFVRVAQSFTGDGSTLGSIQAYIQKVGTPNGNLWIEIFAHTGTFGTSSTPTGSVLATSDNVDSASVSTSYALVTFAFSGANQITLTNGTKYTLVLRGSNSTGGSYFNCGVDSSSPTHAGNLAYSLSAGGAWTALSGYDLPFYVNSAAAIPLLNSFNNYQKGRADSGVSANIGF